jgi:hypothetical protein
MVRLDRLALLEKLALMVRLDRLALLEKLALMVRLDLQVRQVQPVLKVDHFQVKKETLVSI